jgi:hypothetical protein
MSVSLVSCTTDSAESESTPSDPTTPIVTEKNLIVTNTNVPVIDGELLIFVNSSGSPRSSAPVKIGDIVRIESGSTAPPSTQYYVTVIIGTKLIVNQYTTAIGEKMVWEHVVTIEDFQ